MTRTTTATLTEPAEPETLAVQLGNAIKRERRERRITQQTLAERTGIAQADISRLEHGMGNPSARTLMRIAEGLHCRLRFEFVDADAEGDGPW